MDSTDNLKYIIESLLFVSDTPIMLKQIHYIMPDVTMSNIRKAVEALTQEYNEREGSFYLSNVAGGIQLRTRPKFKEWIKRFIRSRPMRLSRAALEALAIVAYKQPVTRAEVDKIRGVDSGAIMRTLVENRLIRIIGRKEVAGRPMLYTTSKRFLEVFDLNDLKDLPAPDDLEIDDADVKVDQETSSEKTEDVSAAEITVQEKTIEPAVEEKTIDSAVEEQSDVEEIPIEPVEEQSDVEEQPIEPAVDEQSDVEEKPIEPTVEEK
ncbi:MAG: segregation and condensation protein B [Candidatus Magnetoglobus multicellularis str. Araruama]|uniref:Segregation and condensation protein B n=1 Tax=Candidatus Magnetoglobus multicellularis str. Araruama TaxID=890399 RepID=A0A1V1NYM2_9BACT|nr:MAG: segregation and condensation protein B [Candidatus Magnetoglobus multicellularis str. Araruama]